MKKTRIRAKLRLETGQQVKAFVRDVGFDMNPNDWVLENFDGSLRINASSLLGVMYASAEWNGEVYLTNIRKNFAFPVFVDKYRF